ncbi:MAG: HAMP domain-containing sensor histidine kinase [Alphaproteobacteria bacterium]|jgi:signal transduction histidine kinase|nr:HAMP domain-containing sensor histidine kinase [Alphaproteobacteria bacterium]
MSSRSLRLRLLLAATITILLALAVAGFGLVLLFERNVERRVGSELDTYLNQIAARVVFNAKGTASLDGKLADPRFEQVYSGLYWQIFDEQTAAHARSRSLWDTRLDLPEDTPALGVIHVHDVAGPENSRLLSHERRLALETGSGEKVLRIAVAIDRADVTALSAEFGSDVMLSLLILATVLILAAWLQVNIGLRPLVAIRQGIAAIGAGRIDRLDTVVPTEVAPLVAEVNDLLDAQDQAMRRARDRAADLAHGFKTPLTALLADANRLRDSGEGDIAGEIERTANQMRGQIDRELSRARIRNVRTLPAVALGPLVEALLGTLKRTPQGEHVELVSDLESGVAARAEPDDLNEILGNLLENAVRHAASKVVVRVARSGSLVRFDIEDDGPGIAKAEREVVMNRGQRLDTSPVGTGLGLAIVKEVLDHYARALTLDRSELGGLKASFEFEASAPDRRTGNG